MKVTLVLSSMILLHCKTLFIETFNISNGIPPINRPDNYQISKTKCSENSVIYFFYFLTKATGNKSSDTEI